MRFFKFVCLILLALIGIVVGSALAESNVSHSVHSESCTNKNVTASPFFVVNGHVYVSFTVPSESCDQVSLVSYTAPSAVYSADTADQQVLYDSDTHDYTTGEYTVAVAIPNCFHQIDLVYGAPIEHLGPANSNNFYSAQNRLIESTLTGTQSCETSTSTVTSTVFSISTTTVTNSTTETVQNTTTQHDTTTTQLPAPPAQTVNNTQTVHDVTTQTTPGQTVTNTTTTTKVVKSKPKVVIHYKVRYKVKKLTPKQQCLAGKANGAHWNNTLHICEFFGNG